MADKKETKTTKKTTTDKKVVKKATPKKEVKVEAKKSEKFAVIAISGVQLKVFEGMGYEVNKLEGKNGDKLEIKEVLLISDGKDTKVGTTYIDGATVKLEITSQKKGKKIEGSLTKLSLDREEDTVTDQVLLEY